MSELDNLYKCRQCFGMTPRDNKYCVWCDVSLPEYELKKNAKDNNPGTPMSQARMLPKSYKKFGEK